MGVRPLRIDEWWLTQMWVLYGCLTRTSNVCYHRVPHESGTSLCLNHTLTAVAYIYHLDASACTVDMHGRVRVTHPITTNEHET